MLGCTYLNCSNVLLKIKLMIMLSVVLNVLCGLFFFLYLLLFFLIIHIVLNYIWTRKSTLLCIIKVFKYFMLVIIVHGLCSGVWRRSKVGRHYYIYISVFFFFFNYDEIWVTRCDEFPRHNKYKYLYLLLHINYMYELFIVMCVCCW